ncbi:MAG TPA: hypothetical protein VEA69_08510 [Tepidisphaeraceae bacterium]|nr:hypothetical protein [Tepidisphaeraceae bacterium]
MAARAPHFPPDELASAPTPAFTDGPRVRAERLARSLQLARGHDAGLLRVLADLWGRRDGRAQLPLDPQPLGGGGAQSVGIGTVPPVAHDRQA